MDVYVSMRGVHFVWGSAKALGNRAKHGISFHRACEAFFDPFLFFEDASVLDESRMAAIGSDLGGTILFVVHLVREDDQIRIISARHADAREKEEYEDPA